MSETQMEIREFEAGDVPFIYNSWLRSYRESPTVRSVPNTIYFDEHHAAIESVIESVSSIVLVACGSEDPEKILGYVVADVQEDCTVVHWVYTKRPYRRQRIAAALLGALRSVASGPVFYTHYTKLADSLKGSQKAIYNPYLLWRK